MAERYVVVDKLKLSYEGLFNMSDLFKTITDWAEEKGYEYKELKNIERVTPDGKFITFVLEPWKKITDYAKNVIRINVHLNNIKEVEIEREGFKVKMNQGKINFVFDGLLETDYENRWELKPTFFIIRTLFDKYFYKPATEGLERHVAGDLKHLHERLKTFLNLYRY